MPAPHDDAPRRIAQAAQTAALLGVDFVPIRRSSGSGDSPPVIVEPKQARPPSPAPEPSGLAPKQARLDELRARYEADAPHAQFVTDHNSIVFGEGDPDARLMFVGEAPGAEEDKTGRPFVGRAGQLLDRMIVAMGMQREDVYICNVLKTRPPNNQTPTSEEAELCRPYLVEQIGIVRPSVIVTLGLPATHTVLRVTGPMARLRAQIHQFGELGGDPIPVSPTYHPAYVLRSYTPEVRGKVWSDLQLALEQAGLQASSGG